MEMVSNIKNDAQSIKKLIDVVAQLRDPTNGCPWDREQTHRSLIPFVLEEAHEVADAIREKDKNHLLEELGDLLLQIILHAQIGTEANLFCFEDIVKGITTKLIRRHPHVFNKQKATSTEEVKKIWEEIKSKENPLPSSKTPISDQLKLKNRSQPAIVGAINISKKASKSLLNWESIEEVWEKFDEEVIELQRALNLEDDLKAEEEMGDVLFTLINIARWYKINPEEGLIRANSKFIRRLSFIENKMDGNLSEFNKPKFKSLWKKAKDYFANIEKNPNKVIK